MSAPTTPKKRGSRTNTFSPLRGVSWTFVTECEGMNRLVEKRDQVFQEQRAGPVPNLGRKVILCQAAIDAIAKEDKVFRGQFAQYDEFCQAVTVPAFPITIKMIALFVFAKLSWRFALYTSTVTYLRRAARVTDGYYDEELQTASLMMSEDEADEVLKSFMREIRAKVEVEKLATSLVEDGVADVKADKELHSLKPSTSPRNNQDDADSASDLEFDKLDEDESAMNQSSQPTRSSGEQGGTNSRSVVQLASPRANFDHVSSRLNSLYMQPTPNLPQPGQHFKQIEDLLAVVYKALIPAYGISCYIPGHCLAINCTRNHSQFNQQHGGRCNWRIATESVGLARDLVVSGDRSHLFHNHGPDPRIIKDPEWRPSINGSRLQRALGLKVTERNATQPKRIRKRPPSTAADSPARSHSESAFKKPRLPSPRAASPVLSASTSAFLSAPSTSTNNHSTSRSPHPSGSLSHSAPHTSNQSIPHPSSSSFPRSTQSRVLPDYASAPHSHLDNASSLPQQLSPSSSDSFLPRLSSFLRSLHPSLDSLATPLFNSGIESLEILQSFCAFESTTIDLYFGVLKERDSDQTISNVHLRLLKKKLGEAQAEEWSN